MATTLTSLPPLGRGKMVSPSDRTICMCIDKNDSALWSVIYNLQSCEIAPLESESDNKEAGAQTMQFPMEAQSFPPPQSVVNVISLHRMQWGQQKPAPRIATTAWGWMAETEPAKEKVKKQLRQEENVELLGNSKTEDGGCCPLSEGPVSPTLQGRLGFGNLGGHWQLDMSSRWGVQAGGSQDGVGCKVKQGWESGNVVVFLVFF